MSSVKKDVEALLFSSGRALSQDALASILDTDPKNIRAALKELKEDYEARDTALKIFQEGEEWKMLVRDAHIPVVQRVVADTEFGRPTLETLAVIAYKNPILQSEVIEKRGSHAYEHIKELEKAGFVTKQPEGRSYKLKLAEKFFEYFDVEGEDDIREVFKNVQEPEVPDHLGEMKVVDVEDDSQEEENPFMTRELGTKPEMTPEERADREKFLDEIDKKLHDTASRNDEHEKDETLRLREDESEDDDEDSESEDGSEDDESDSQDDDSETSDKSQESEGSEDDSDDSQTKKPLDELPDGSPEDDVEKL